jgi:hypothetical protein
MRPRIAFGETFSVAAGDTPAATVLESNARSGCVRSIYSFKTGQIKAPDDF